LQPLVTSCSQTSLYYILYTTICEGVATPSPLVSSVILGSATTGSQYLAVRRNDSCRLRGSGSIVTAQQQAVHDLFPVHLYFSNMELLEFRAGLLNILGSASPTLSIL
jgi:hypothetical protein